MTKERLEKLASLRREITRTNERLRELKATQASSARYKEIISRTETALENYLEEAEWETAALLEYIEKIEDRKMRELFMLRYYDGIRSWQRIAFMVGEYDESYIRKKHNAYLRKTEEGIFPN